MKIAVDTRNIGDNRHEAYGTFLYQLLKKAAEKNPNHEFLFIFDRPYDLKFLFDKNIMPVIIGPKTNNLLLRKIWYDVKIPALLRKYKADIFIGNGICSLTGKTPQCIIIDDLSFLNSPSFHKKTELLFLKKYFKKFLQKAKSIITTSEYMEKKLQSRYSVEEKKIIVITGGAPDVFCVLDENNKDAVRRKYTGNKNFFIYAGNIHPGKNLVNLLKAFSIFKRRQKSDWKLVLASEATAGYKSFFETLQTYKYRDEVIIAGNLHYGEIVRLIASAYAIVCPSADEGCGMQILGAMKSHTPVIAAGKSAMQEIGGDAALYFDPISHTDLADKMMILYKDELLRNKLVEKGKIVVVHYEWEKMTDLFWQSILKAIK